MFEKRTIRVTGKGSIKVTPDMMRITITMKKTRESYEETMRCSSEDTKELQELLSEFGFQKSDLKTLSFDVDSEFERYQDANGIYQKKFLGYSYEHEMKVEFERDNDRLGKILYALAKCPLKPEFRISYFVRDREAAKNKLLGNAVRDAAAKASVLAEAAGVELEDIQTIDYSWGRVDFEFDDVGMARPGVCLEASAGSRSFDMDINPDDIEVEDTVTVIWGIE
ncbi:MAG: SIMPL domain-containing protein [Eubacterium sp.]